MIDIKLLTPEENAQLPLVLSRRVRFKKLLGTSIINYDRIFSNCIMIQGKPGTGKTTLVMEYLEQLKSAGSIAGYRRAAGHITPRSLYCLLEETHKPVDGLPMVLVLDDVDCLKDQGCLELMKAAFDTKSKGPTNRQVYYMTEDKKGFKYNGFCIIITNDNFVPDKTPVHLQALLDRIQQTTSDLRKEDGIIYNTFLVEDYLKKNEDGLSDAQITSIIDLFHNEIHKWMETDAFRASGINFSIRLIKKFIDAQRIFGDDWREFNTSYLTLEATRELQEAKASEPVETTDEVLQGIVDASGVEIQLPPTDASGWYLNPRTGKPYSLARHTYYRKLAELKRA